MENLKHNIFRLLGSVYIPQKLYSNDEKKILHISDTPQNFFSTLTKLIKNIQPSYIIHTGDLVDNIKLGLNPTSLTEYKKEISILLNILEQSTAEEIYITLGNHDNKEVVKDMARRSIIIEKAKILNIENLQFKVSHYIKDFKKESAQYNLFGHDIHPSSSYDDGKIFLNGIQAINVITTNSEQVFSLPYPLGTNESRLGKFKIGI